MKEYIRIRILSTIRLFRDFPFPIQLLIIAAGLLAIYALWSVNVELSVKSFLILIAVQLLISYLKAAPSTKEKVLLHDAKIPLWKVKTFRTLLIAIPFILISPVMGSAGTIAGIGLVMIINDQKGFSFGQIVIPTLFCKTSYRWIMAFRKGSIWIICIFLFLQLMAVLHNNMNLAKISVLLLTCIPCLFMMYTTPEPREFLYVYRNARSLLFIKTSENLINTSVLLLFSLPLTIYLVIVGEVSVLLIIASAVYINLMMEYIFYIFYPSVLLSLIMLGLVLITLITIAIQLPLWAAVIILTASALIACFIAYSTIKYTLHEHD